jgi:hypothetical protein
LASEILYGNLQNGGEVSLILVDSKITFDYTQTKAKSAAIETVE